MSKPSLGNSRAPWSRLLGGRAASPGITAKIQALVMLPIMLLLIIAVVQSLAANNQFETTLTEMSNDTKAGARTTTKLIAAQGSIANLMMALSDLAILHQQGLAAGAATATVATKREALLDQSSKLWEALGTLEPGIVGSPRIATDVDDGDRLAQKAAYVQRSGTVVPRLVELYLQAHDRTLAMLNDGQLDKARTNFRYEEQPRLRAVRDRVDRTVTLLDQAATGISAQVVEASRARAAEALSDVEDSTIVTVIALVTLALLVSAAGIAYALLGLSRPLRAVVACLRALADGKTDIAIPRARGDEIGAIVETLSTFRENLIERARMVEAREETEQRTKEEREATQQRVEAEREEARRVAEAERERLRKQAEKELEAERQSAEEQRDIEREEALRVAEAERERLRKRAENELEAERQRAEEQREAERRSAEEEREVERQRAEEQRNAEREEAVRVAEAERERLRESAEEEREAERLRAEEEREAQRQRAAERAEAARLRGEEERKAMLASLARDFEEKVGAIVAKLASSSGELSGQAKIMLDGAAQSAENLREVSQSCEMTSSSVAAVAAATEQMTASFAETADKVATASEVASEAQDGMERSRHTIQEMTEIANGIGDVTAIIDNIAEQTNLLALNATIEAARAGEAGKGFAVVADEVRALARQTATATSDIAGQVTKIQAATTRTAEGSQTAASSVARVHEIAFALTDMVRQQQSTTNEISNSIQSAADGTRIVTESMDGLGNEVERTREQANAVLESAEELTAQAALLDEEVEAFLAGVRSA